MKRTLSFVILMVVVAAMSNAQGVLERLGKRIVKRAGEQVEQRVEQKAEEGVENAMDKTEGAVKKTGKSTGKKGEKGEATNENQQDDTSLKQTSQQEKVSLQSYSQYDFVPGDKILFYEDFSQDAIGDFPALWTTNGSGEVKTVNIAPGNWLHMNGADAVYCLLKSLPLPDNFIVEFDIIPDDKYQYGITFTLYEDEQTEQKEMNDDLYPGIKGLHITPKQDGWSVRGYWNADNKDWLEGQGTVNPVTISETNHVIVWVQKRRTRIYHEGKKVLDSPTIIYPETRFNRIRFSGWDAYSYPYVTNLKITTASPDTRNKLLEEGKLISYGIYFDINSDRVKPESYGALSDIAKIIKEAGVNVRIDGHTDNTGSEATNLDLSKRRAASVKAELVKMGISTNQLSTDGMGASKPIAPNDTPSNKAMNRRVEFIKL